MTVRKVHRRHVQLEWEYLILSLILQNGKQTTISNREVANMTGYSVEYIKRLFRDLRKKGYFTQEYISVPGGSRRLITITKVGKTRWKELNANKEIKKKWGGL